MIKVAPSILAADMLHLYDEIQKVMTAGCVLLHVDVMDGHFVPNLSFGPDVVQEIHAAFPELKLDIHLMMEHPEKYIERFAPGAWNITIHEEIPADPSAVLDQIHACGVRRGISLKPATPVSKILHLLDKTDMVLIMTVEPGFGGQSFQWGMLDKLRELRKAGYTGLLEADGGLKMENLPDLRQAGLDIAVMGTAVYRSAHLADDLTMIHSL